MTDSSQPHGLWPTRLLCPWDSPGKNPGVGGHSLLQGVFLTQEPNPRDSLTSEPPGKSTKEARPACPRQKQGAHTAGSWPLPQQSSPHRPDLQAGPGDLRGPGREPATWSGVWSTGCQRLTAGVAQESECGAAPKCRMGLSPLRVRRHTHLLLRFLGGQQSGYFRAVHVRVLSHCSRSDSLTLWTVARQAPLSTGFSRQEYCHFPLQGIFPNPGIKPSSPVSPALQTYP